MPCTGTSSFADWWTRLPTTTATMTLVQTSDGASFAFTSANLYPIPGQPWYTMEVGQGLVYRVQEWVRALARIVISGRLYLRVAACNGHQLLGGQYAMCIADEP